MDTEVMCMKFAVVGGDERSARLCRLLLNDGHKVSSYALERAALPANVQRAGCIQACVYGADCVILPVPAERAGVLVSPLSGEHVSMAELIPALWPGQLLVAGKLGEESCLAAIRAGLTVEDIMLRRGYAVGNAAITAEGAIERMMSQSPRTLWQSRVLVTGWGKLAKVLSLRLCALGARVTVAARREGDRAMASALGAEGVEFCTLESRLSDFEFVVNTVPARVFSDAMLCLIREDALLLELASAPGGFDAALAENIGLHVCCAPGLPGQCAPETAAELIRNAVYDVLREQEE